MYIWRGRVSFNSILYDVVRGRYSVWCFYCMMFIEESHQ